MINVHLDSTAEDDIRRERLFAGDLFLFSARESVLALCAHADEIIRKAFGSVDDSPERAQFHLPVETFVTLAAPLKTEFTNSQRTKDLVRAILTEFGCQLDDTYFDVPRLRIVTHAGYLTAGVGYAYKAHRDTWYAGPPQQLNWWFPVYDLAAERAMSLYPAYFDRPLPNSSAGFDYDEWMREGRVKAVQNIKEDTRKHPLPNTPPDESTEMRVVSRAGELLQFSAGHLHATAPNQSGVTRFSIDFRTVHRRDLATSRGAPNVDNASRGSTLGDFLRGVDFSPISTPVASAI